MASVIDMIIATADPMAMYMMAVPLVAKAALSLLPNTSRTFLDLGSVRLKSNESVN